MNNSNRKKRTVSEEHTVVDEVLNSFQRLGEDDTPVDEITHKIESLYNLLNDQEKESLFMAMIEQIEVPKEEIEPVVESFIKCEEDDPQWRTLLAELRNRFYSPRLMLFRKISRSPGGLKFLLDFRGDLLSLRRKSEYDLRPLDADIVFLFEMWFQEGFLYLEEITLDSAYKQIELIKDRDLVHPMASIEEMGRRLGMDRRCFALYHRLLPFEPIVFIEVALTEGLARNVSEVMAGAGSKRRKRADTAIFYSINNTQNGLAGLGLGKMLIGRVVEYLREENEGIKNFATLSPVPRFWKGYLKLLLEGNDANFRLKSQDVISFFSKKAVGKIMDRTAFDKPDSGHFNAALLSVLSDNGWAKEEEMIKNLRNPLSKIAYQYIIGEKNRREKPLNPVAGFHLGNGATVSAKNINFLANPSSRGLKESCGIMVNYVYTSSWLSQIRRSFRWFGRMEIKGLFRQRHDRVSSF